MGAGEMEEEPHDEGEFSFTGDVEDLSGDEAFGVGYKAGQEEVKDELERLLRGLDGPPGEEMGDNSIPFLEEDDSDDHTGQSCEEAHTGCSHEAYIAGQC